MDEGRWPLLKRLLQLSNVVNGCMRFQVASSYVVAASQEGEGHLLFC